MTLLQVSTRRALACGASILGLTLALASQAAAADTAAAVTAQAASEGAAVDELVVVGNSRATAVLASPTPVEVVGTQEMKKTGGVVIQQSLQRSVAAFNFPQGQNAQKGSAGVRSASLRGLSPNFTLVLVDGKRRYFSAYAGGADPFPGTNYVDINTLPSSAIKRVELLRDGASAQYGTDAIAGVVNFILREDAEGGEINAEYGQYSAGDGLTRSLDGWWGTHLPRNGFLNLSFDISKRDGTDRSGSDIRQRYFAGDPREATADRSHVGRWGNSDVEHSAFLANSAFDVSSNLRAYAWANYSRTRSYNGVNPQTPASDFNIRAIYPDGFQPITDWRLEDYSATAGVKYDGGGLGKFDLGVNYGKNRAENYQHHTLSPSFGLATKRDFYDGAWEADQTNLFLDWTKDLRTGGLADPVALSAGLTYRTETWAATEPGELQSWANGGVPILDGPNAGKPARFGVTDIAGTNPADLGSFDRDVFGAYVSADANLTSKLKLGGALRFENYSDFGDTTIGKLSARYDFTDKIAVRGTVSSGFRAPSLGQLGQQVTTSSGTFSFSGAILPTTQTRRYRPGDPIAARLGGGPLDPEESRNVSAGLVFRPTPSTSVTIDAYEIDIDGLILLAQGATGNGLTGGYVTAATASVGTPGITAVSFYTNGVDVKTRGVDIVAKHGFDLGDKGQLDLQLSYSTFDTKTSNVKTGVGGAALFTRGQILDLKKATPDYKAIFTARYARGRWDATVNQIRYGQYTYVHPTVPANDQTYKASWVTHAELGYALSDRTRIAVGGNNIFDAYPEQFVAANRVNGINRYGFISPEGASGAFYYTRFSHAF